VALKLIGGVEFEIAIGAGVPVREQGPKTWVSAWKAALNEQQGKSNASNAIGYISMVVT
jgi:hypothetical protein